MWSIVENKQKFISQIMTSKTADRSCEDIDETVLSYAEVKALATGNPYIREKIDVDNEVARLSLLKTAFDNHKYKMEDNFKSKYPKLINETEHRIINIKSDIEIRNLNKKDEFEIVIKNKTYDNREDAGLIIKFILNEIPIGEEIHIGNFSGFELYIAGKYLGANEMIIKGKNIYHVELGDSNQGNIARLENVIKGFEGSIDRLEEKIVEYNRNMDESKAEFEKTFEYEVLLTEKLKRQFELNELLNINKKEDIEEISEEVESESKIIDNVGKKKSISDVAKLIEKNRTDIGNTHITSKENDKTI